MKQLKLLSLAISAAITASPTLLQAQENEENGADDSERIMITGSRIARTELASASPIAVVSKEDLENIGITDVSAALRRLPALTGNTANNQTSSGANAIQTATLRGIEATNTLILLNGRRIVGSTADGLVDLSSIPFESIEEIQVLKDGASAIYGSDAIAGVINIITRRNFEGLDFNVHYGQSRHGDADERKVGLVLGGSSDKGDFLIAASAQNNNGWRERDRYMTRDADQRYLGGDNGNSGTAPNAQLTGFGLGPGSWTILDANDPAGSVVPFVYDEMGYNYRDAQSGANDNKTVSVFASGTYEMNETTSFFGEFSLHDGFVRGNQAPPGTSTSWYGSSIDTPNAFRRYTDADGNNYGVGANQRYNPFGEVGNVSRRFSEYGSRIYSTENNILRYTLGFNGLLANEYDWEISASSQQSRLTTAGGAQPSLIQIERALSDECETAADPDCVALNVFGPPGSITQAMLDFINTTAPLTTNKNDLSFFQASISGSVTELPAGEMMFAVGFEHREDQQSLEADISQRTETFDVSWGGTTTPVISPNREIDELYAEFVIPAAENLEIEAAVRYSDYSDIDESTTNPKFGVRYSPTDELTLRASYSTGFRAPTMNEMYAGRTSNIQTNLHDPCNMDNDNTIDAGAPASCSSLNPAEIRNEIQSYDQIGGGNVDLKPEKATNMTFGVVYEASDDFSITLDYFDIQQEDVVFASTEYVIDQAVAGNPEYVNDVVRSANGTGYIAFVFAPANNIAERQVSGIDVTVNYNWESSIGNWNLVADLTRLTKFDVQDVSGQPFRDAVGTYDSAFGSLPETKLTLILDWSYDDWKATYSSTYNSDIAADDDDVMDATMIHNAQVAYLWDTNAEVHFGIQNLLDEDPPFLKANGTATDDNLYSFRGRFFYVGAKYSF